MEASGDYFWCSGGCSKLEFVGAILLAVLMEGSRMVLPPFNDALLLKLAQFVGFLMTTKKLFAGHMY